MFMVLSGIFRDKSNLVIPCTTEERNKAYNSILKSFCQSHLTTNPHPCYLNSGRNTRELSTGFISGVLVYKRLQTPGTPPNRKAVATHEVVASAGIFNSGDAKTRGGTL